MAKGRGDPSRGSVAADLNTAVSQIEQPQKDGDQSAAAAQLAFMAELQGLPDSRTLSYPLGIPKPERPQRKRRTKHLPDELYCRSCGTTETPEWRRGPDGMKSLCNACGLHFSKIIRRELMVRPQEMGASKKCNIDYILN
eukprot:TRINITY_DN58_c0_g1_i1.p1 TRINITY_DN58_c0_g1~~TRINITY_DN58_c0_g1_i1.p1  ORF type:complete len:140 (-),score=31.83 TRINITY_DN58_c0_g1_i1:368-787(-)